LDINRYVQKQEKVKATLISRSPFPLETDSSHYAIGLSAPMASPDPRSSGVADESDDDYAFARLPI